MKRLMLMAFAAVCSAAAADLPTYWIGTAKLPDGSSTDAYLTLHQRDQTIIGTFAFVEKTRKNPLKKVQLNGDQLTFQIHDPTPRLAVFHLPLTADGLLKGEARSADRVIEVQLSAVGLS